MQLFAYKIKSEDIYEEFFKHKHLPDYSNYPKEAIFKTQVRRMQARLRRMRRTWRTRQIQRTWWIWRIRQTRRIRQIQWIWRIPILIRI